MRGFDERQSGLFSYRRPSRRYSRRVRHSMGYNGTLRKTPGLETQKWLEIMTPRSPVSLVSLFVCCLLLAAWSPMSSASLRCCYSGDVVEMKLADVEVKLEDGRLVAFGELFPDFTPSTSFFTLFFPVYRLDIARVVYPHLAVKFVAYDANANGFIEEPELTVLYMEEVVRGLDQAIAHLGGENPLRAIFASNGDIDGLMRLVDRRRSEMKPEVRMTFDELDLLRIDFRLDGTVPGEQGNGSFSP